MKRNMGILHRTFYVLTGAGLVAWPFLVKLESPWRFLAPILGVITLASGGVGW